MNTVLTLYDRPDEWYQSTYICCECKEQFMTDHEKIPKFCPCCGVRYDAMRIKYDVEEGGRMKTVFIKDEEEEVEPIYCDTDSLKEADKMKIKQLFNEKYGVASSDKEVIENEDVHQD